VLIDWFTVGIQIVNFLILVALLKHFLYGPVLKAMAAREAKIAAQLDAAEAEKQRARAEAESYRKKNADWEAEQLAMRAQAKDAAKIERSALIEQAHQEVTLLQAKWREAIELQKAAFLRDLRTRVIRQVYDTARRVLKDLANADLEHQITAVFIDRLQKMAPKKWREIGAALQDGENSLFIESSFEMPDEAREKIAGLLQKRFSQKIVPVYKIEADTVCGIVLKAPGHKVAWHLDDYLETLEEEISKHFAAPKQKPKKKTAV